MESLAAVGLMAALHVAGGTVRALDRVPRSRVLSAAGGVAVAYVFVHLLPELARIQEAVTRTGSLQTLERHTYLVALIGVTLFYSLEQLARRSSGDPAAKDTVGWLQVASYAAYNAVIGYVLVQREADGRSLWFFAVAIGLHMLVNDHGLRHHHGRLYHGRGRWVVTGALVGGWALGRSTTLGEAVVGIPLAFVAGGVILNILKEELPEDRASRITPFLLSAAVYAALLLAV